MTPEEVERLRQDADEWEKEYRDKVFRCPFCFEAVICYEDMDTPAGDTMDGGFCENCGAAFAYDRTGKRGGDIYMDAVALAYEWDYDKAVEGAEGGYEEAIVRYNPRVGKYLLGEGDRRDRSPSYVFIKRKKAG
jgi:transcription elongation factor Elf1